MHLSPILKSAFNPVFLEGTTLEDTWFRLLRLVWEQGRMGPEITSGSFAGSHRLTFDDVAGFIHFPHQRPLAPVMPEGLGIAPPTTDEKIEDYFNNYLLNNELAEREEYRYSIWICGGWTPKPYHDCPIDQLQWVVNHFKTHGYYNEHCYMTIGNPSSSIAYDQPYKDCPELGCVNNNLHSHEVTECPSCGTGLVKNEALRGTSPCLRGLDFGIRDIDGTDYLFTKVLYRSWDLFAGWPENMGGFTRLNEFVAEQLDDVHPGPLSFTCKSLHCYDHQIEPLKTVLHIQD